MYIWNNSYFIYSPLVPETDQSLILTSLLHVKLICSKNILFLSFLFSSPSRKSNRNPCLKSSTWFECIELFLITYRSVKEEDWDSPYKRSRRNKGAQDHTQASTNLHKTNRRCNEAEHMVAINIIFQNSLMFTNISLIKNPNSLSKYLQNARCSSSLPNSYPFHWSFPLPLLTCNVSSSL